MLVLTRKPQEKLVIDYHGMKIVITVCAIEGSRVRLGIDAPKSVRIDREEIHDKRNAEERREQVPIGLAHEFGDGDTHDFALIERDRLSDSARFLG